MTTRRFSLSVLLLLALFIPIGLLAQVDAGKIVGTVTDSTGAVVSSAPISIKNVNTGLQRSSVTTNTGSFNFADVPSGQYLLTVTATGFNPFSQQVQVTVGGAVTVDPKLAVQGGATSVEVTESGIAEINTTNQEISQVIDAKQIANLPSLTRNPYDFVALSGNISGDPNGSTGGNGVGVSIDGLRSASTEILLDGSENVDLYSASIGQNIPLDAVAEFRVITNGFSAEYGRASGGVVNLTSRTGTNKFHGSLYEYNRVAALAANTFNEDSINFVNKQIGAPKLPKDQFTRNQFGYSVGGPVFRDKLFFFSNTEWTRIRSSGQQFAEVPTAAFLATTSATTQAFFTQYGKLDPGAKLGAVSTTHPEFQEVSYSVPTNAGAGSPQNTYETFNRVDWNVSQKTSFFARYALDSFDFPAGSNASSPYNGYNTGEKDYDQAILLSLTHLFSPNFASASKISFNRLNQAQPLGSAPVGPTLYTNSTSATSVDGNNIAFPGYLPFSPGSAIPFGGPQNLYQFGEDLSWTKGRHTLRFGGQFTQLRDNRLFGAYENSVEGLANTSGHFFGGSYTKGGKTYQSGLQNLVNGQLYNFQGAINPQGKTPCYYDSNSVTIQTPACTITLPAVSPSFTRENTFNDGAWYVQDSWTLFPSFTLNAGVRWEYYGVQHNTKPGLESNFFLGTGASIYDKIRNGQVLTTPNSPTHGLIGQKFNNYAPRIGFAWDVFGDGKWAVRGGYGISYERNFGNVTYNAIQNPPGYAVISLIAQTDVPTIALSSDNAGPLAGSGSKALPHTSLRAIQQDIPVSYASQYNFNIQHQLSHRDVLAIEYSGSRGIHQYSIANINRQYYGNIFLNDPNVDAANALNYQYSNINYRGAAGDSYYQALNVRFESTNLANQGLTLTSNYTFAHSMDSLSSTFSQSGNNFNLGYLDPFDTSFDRGNSDFDTRHRLVVGAVYEPKFFQFNSSHLLHTALGGLTFAPIFNANSGTAFTVYDCTAAVYTCTRIQRVAGQQYRGHAQNEGGVNAYNFLEIPASSQNLYADPIVGASDMPTCSGGTCFLQPGQGRNQWYGPAFWNLDLGAYKNFHITERFNVQLRGEFYDLFNHHNLYVNGGNADISQQNPFDSKTGFYTGPGYVQAAKGAPGGVASSLDERRNVQLALRLEF